MRFSPLNQLLSVVAVVLATSSLAGCAAPPNFSEHAARSTTADLPSGCSEVLRTWATSTERFGAVKATNDGTVSNSLADVALNRTPTCTFSDENGVPAVAMWITTDLTISQSAFEEIRSSFSEDSRFTEATHSESSHASTFTRDLAAAVTQVSIYVADSAFLTTMGYTEDTTLVIAHREDHKSP